MLADNKLLVTTSMPAPAVFEYAEISVGGWVMKNHIKCKRFPQQPENSNLPSKKKPEPERINMSEDENDLNDEESQTEDLPAEDFIRLDQFLKLNGITRSGGEAKHLIQEGKVKVNGLVETRRKKKLHVGDIVETLGQRMQIERG
jgi:ribosome-associated protein